MRVAVQIRDRAVERVEDPPAPARAALAGALLGQQPVLGSLPEQDVADQRLGVAVCVRDRIRGTRLRPEPARRPAEPLQKQRTRLASGPLGESEIVAQKIARMSRTRMTIVATVASE
jgi:hypothetical protein